VLDLAHAVFGPQDVALKQAGRAMAKAEMHLRLQDYFEKRAHQLRSWAAKYHVASLWEDQGRITLNSVLVLLVSSRTCSAQEYVALTATCRDNCRSMGKLEVLVPLCELLLIGFAEVRGLTDGAASSLKGLDACSESAKLRLESLTKVDLNTLKAAAANKGSYRSELLDLPRAMVQCALPMRPFVGRPVLEMASQVLQPNEKAHDDFAIHRLASDPHLAELASGFGVPQSQQLQLAHRQRFLKHMSCHTDVVQHLASSGSDAIGALAEWLQSVQAALIEVPKICGTYRAKEAILSHIVPLAKWTLRPHGQRALFGRPVPPKLLEAVPAAAPATVQRATASSPRLSQSAHHREIVPPTSRAPAFHRTVPQHQRGEQVKRCSSTPNSIDASGKVTDVPRQGGQKSSRQSSSPQNIPVAAAALSESPSVGMGALRAIDLWLREHGLPDQQQLMPPRLASKPKEEAPGTGVPPHVQRRAISTCSTASTIEDFQHDQVATQPVSTDAPLLLELSSDDEDVSDLGASSLLM
jgi:hypothetical protein